MTVSIIFDHVIVKIDIPYYSDNMIIDIKFMNDN